MSKRKFYIFLLLPILLAITVLLVGCGNSYMGLATRWLPDNTLETSFYERSTYKATPYSTTNADGLTFELTEGNFEQTVEGKRDNISSPLISNGAVLPRDVYKYTTKLTLKGKYTYQGQEHTINDNSIETEVFFAISTEGFKPLTSTQKIKSTTPVKNYNTKNYEFIAYEYTVNKYYNADASMVRVQTTPAAGNTTIKEETKEFNSINKNNSPYDNAQLYFIARAMQDQLNTVNTIIENGVLPTSINLSTGKENLTLLNEQNAKEYGVTNVTLTVATNGIGKGPARSLTLLSTETFKHFIYRIREVMPYSLGSITFTLGSISTTPPSSNLAP